MPFKDLREFIDKLEKEGEAQSIDEEVDWNLEAGAMLRRATEQNFPAPFFQKIKDYPNGYRLFGGSLANYRRIAIAMDKSPDTSQQELMEEYLKRKKRTLKPVLVHEAPCKENIARGEEVDLLKLPVPFLHEGDGGRYLGTFHLTISKDLDSDWVNWGMYRSMLHDQNSVSMWATPGSHLDGMYKRSYEPQGIPMEVAIVLGTEPISALCTAIPIAYGVSEVDVAGGIRGEPVELVKCETIDLEVPATAEIVIEGEMRPHERKDEGPFGDFTGYVTHGRKSVPVVHVKAITYRNDPIFTMSCMGIPVDDDTAIHSVTKGAEYLEALRASGLPVTGVCVLAEASELITVVAVKPPFSNVAEVIADIVWGTRAGRHLPYIIVVNDDVDPFDRSQVWHALATKCHPDRGIVKRKRGVLMPLLPSATSYERRHGLGARTYFDCTWPLDCDPKKLPKRVSFKEIYPEEIQQKALAKWKKYGY